MLKSLSGSFRRKTSREGMPNDKAVETEMKSQEVAPPTTTTTATEEGAEGVVEVQPRDVPQTGEGEEGPVEVQPRAFGDGGGFPGMGGGFGGQGGMGMGGGYGGQGGGFGGGQGQGQGEDPLAACMPCLMCLPLLLAGSGMMGGGQGQQGQSQGGMGGMGGGFGGMGGAPQSQGMMGRPPYGAQQGYGGNNNNNNNNNNPFGQPSRPSNSNPFGAQPSNGNPFMGGQGQGGMYGQPSAPSYDSRPPATAPGYGDSMGMGGYPAGGNRPPQMYGGQQQAQRPPNTTVVHQQMGGSHRLASDLSGRKKALFIGICYTGTDAALRGCVNDCKSLYQFITQNYGFDPDNIQVLTDDKSFSMALPTRENIIRGMQWLVQGARQGDSLFFHYSGMDETILPLDFKRTGEIIDDDIHTLLVKPLCRGVRLTCIFDSCHSGSVMDLPFSYRVDGSLEIVQIDNTQAAMSSLMNAGAAFMMGDKAGGVMGMIEGLAALAGGSSGNEQAKVKTERENQSEADVIQFAGCRDDQTSADAQANGTAFGAMSHTFVQVLQGRPSMTYTELLKRMREVMRGRYSQIPQMSTSHVMDLQVPFGM